MKVFLSVLLALMALFPIVGFAGGDAIGSLPSVTTTDTHVVKPGETWTNSDGVTVVNDITSCGNVRVVTTTDQHGVIRTDVTLKNGAKANVSGLDGNDSEHVGANCTGTTTAEGGATITIAGGSLETCHNSGTEPLVIQTPAGGHTDVPPGGTVTVGT